MRPGTLPFGVRVLYISYDGVLEPPGESQVVGYLERLASEHTITLLTFEQPKDLSDRPRVAAMSRRLDARHITWIRRRHRRRPRFVLTALAIVRGVLRARGACRRSDVQVIHASGFVAALIALYARRASGASLLFDMRGFWIAEKVEAGHWKTGSWLYRAGKRWERRVFRVASAVVSPTAEGIRALPELGVTLRSKVPIEVIPACVDLQRFTPGTKNSELVAALGLADAAVIGCVGSMSGRYMRDETLQYLAHLTRALERVKILVVTLDDHLALRQDAEAAGVPPDALVITRAAGADMPRFTRLFDAGVCFIRPSLSTRAFAPIKLAEFLACGVPVIVNDRVGDSGPIVRDGGAGVVLAALDAASFERSLPAVGAALGDAAMRDRCRALAVQRFDVDRGVELYGQMYRQLVGTGSRR